MEFLPAGEYLFVKLLVMFLGEKADLSIQSPQYMLKLEKKFYEEIV